MPRKIWTSFTAGERPSWELGRINTAEYQNGLSLAQNVVIEHGAIRKRFGATAITKTTTGATHTPTNNPLVSGYGDKQFDTTGMYQFSLGGTRAGGDIVVYQPLTFNNMNTPTWRHDNVFCYLDGGGGFRAAYVDPVTYAITYYDGKGSFVTESWGRRIFVGNSNNKISFKTSKAGDMTDFSFIDVTLTNIYSEDPINIDLGGFGDILWISDGFGLFIGTTRGLYQIVSGLGPGFSPLEGGFYPQSLDNYRSIDVTHAQSKAKNQTVAITSESVCFVSNFDEVSVCSRQQRSINKVKLEIPTTHAIDSIAWAGGDMIAVLVADIEKRKLWATGNTYDGSNNFIFLVGENDGLVTRITGINPITIGNLGIAGFMYKASDGSALKVGYIPYAERSKYDPTPQVLVQDGYYDYTAATPFTAKIVTTPIHFGADMSDKRRLVKLTVRVRNTNHFKVYMWGQDTDAMPSIAGGFPINWTPQVTEWTAPGAAGTLYTGDVDLFIDGRIGTYVQIGIEDNSVYPLEILAIQADFELNSEAVE